MHGVKSTPSSSFLFEKLIFAASTMVAKKSREEMFLSKETPDG